MTDQNTERCGEDIISPDRRSRKRPLDLADSSTEGSEMKKTSTRLEVSDSEQPDPAYGTKDYWEMRYKGFKDGDPTEKEAPEAQHSWYFTYEDLSPLLLPLVVGDEIYSIPSSKREKSKEEQDCTEEKVETAQQSSGNEIVEIDPINEFNFEDTMVEETDSDSGDEGEESIEEIDDEEGEEEDSEIPERPGLAKGGPIEVLEIGCGDVPLGTGLLAGIAELESRGLTTTNETLKRVTCMDYSKHVIDDMKVKQKLGTFGGGPLTFECADARKLPYKNESFKLVLEKGTMDAMLSDKESGGDNCRDIVAEMARVLSSGGCAVVISHLNANSEEGLEWLESIVVPGLRSGAGQFHWQIEVHGGEPSEKTTSDEDETILGPAVYFIQKGDRFSTHSHSHSQNAIDCDSSIEEQPTIPLRFFSY